MDITKGPNPALRGNYPELHGPQQAAARPMVEVRVARVYGKPTIYPANDRARQFAELIGAKTFNVDQLNRIIALGFGVIEVRDNHGVNIPEAR